MKADTNPQNKLTSSQKEAVGLLSIGTFLEYFDLMLYVHMAVLLNELFFPKTDPFTASLLSAFAFCSTFVFRPFGALLFGYIGDNIGRKATVVITTFLMAISCVVMANLPTYAEIGITAAWIVTICRIVQGISSMGERVGAELYLTESIKLPTRYPAVAFIGLCASLGLTCALGVASLVTSTSFNWRIAFWVGAGIALVGSIARTSLRETPDFIDAKRRLNKVLETVEMDKNEIDTNAISQDKIITKTTISFFLIQLAQPIWFYFAYIHCSNILQNNFNYSSEAVIQQNFIISCIELFVTICLTYLCYKVNPLKILKLQLTIFSTFILLCPFILNNISTGYGIFFIQCFVVIFSPSEFPATPIFYKSFPVLRRFTSASFIYATSRAIMYLISSFGLLYLTKHLGNWGILIIMVPIAIGYGYGLFHFRKINQEDRKNDY